ncbi:MULTISPECIES: metallophosphoesterase family protein [Chryseobacterium]|uniref:Serine/threonine protein phosphatase 1 n=1 Tax=Chryseobacterium camelliae TaxID=1265445 RepID=A0ABU0TPI8_9FLAO|nr:MULTISPECIES: metallophosphoesterase family protein [Chryseobacterium]MDT3407904.1 serine/threonine protein phosphatase 1 [Pseudacidovorax intermedius]MDQ1098240.1 serine/threonine protein phosphatase 1 [Chryseobacterium camelliae]MDQ1102166.1 serine/threonine protein phosphatase 1 [Chryseobacterium sp. SORGH_AS_1048]MDR6085604.1 serine/threonine protein phosphatase 1 [Chryseobacterium sp. SORGH_AS_0909]MDR6129966.1 serine/threonine protein phosphatase 1 [Chryseobacterium sp. SORGH_AS_1175]
MKRTLAIGDIHGGFKALKQVLERAKVTKDDALIFLGDYVDGWSESAKVIDFLMKVAERQECIFIRGNHDAWCEDWLFFGKNEDIWLSNGGKSTVESYTGYSPDELEMHLEFFRQMKNYHVDEENRLFIHAGYSSMHGPDKEVYSTNYRWDRTLWETAVAMDKKLSKNSISYPKRLLLYKEIFIGHTPTLHLESTEPMNKANIWNLDTGAAFTGSLTIMDIKTKEFWQSDPLPALYPDEKGRNKDAVKMIR